MRIGIDIRSTLKQKTGIGYSTLNLINHLARIDPQNKYVLYSRIKPFSRNKRLPPLPGKNFCHRVNRFNFSLDCVLGKVDVFYTSSHDLPGLKSGKFIVAVYDVIHKTYPDGHSKDTREEIDKNLRRILNEVDKIIVCSRVTRSDILKWYSVPEEKIRLIYPGVSEQINRIEKSDNLYSRLKDRYNVSGKYLLFVGTIEPRKNIEGLIKAYHILKTEHKLPYQLVIVGMKGWMYSGVFELVETYGLKNEVIFTGYLDEDLKNIFYNLADIFIYPSFYEGFGFPIVEAFKCGVPVITSNTSSCAEVAGDAAMLINPYNPDSIVEAVLKIINNINLRNQLKNKGLEKTKFFSWKETAKKTLEVFYEVGREK